MNSLTSRIVLKQNSSFHPTHPANQDGVFFCKIKLKMRKSLNGIWAVVLNLCYNQLIIGTRWTRTILSVGLLTTWLSKQVISRRDCKPSAGRLILHLFLCHVSNSFTQILFSVVAFSTDLRQLSGIIEAIFTDGLTLPMLHKIWLQKMKAVHWRGENCLVSCSLDLQTFFTWELSAPELPSIFFSNIFHMLLQ